MQPIKVYATYPNGTFLEQVGEENRGGGHWLTLVHVESGH